MTRRECDAFEHGWADGAAGRAYQTAREVLERLPYDSERAAAYLNGAEDGRAGDRFRLDGGKP